jgi:hypothetical protein
MRRHGKRGPPLACANIMVQDSKPFTLSCTATELCAFTLSSIGARVTSLVSEGRGSHSYRWQQWDNLSKEKLFLQRLVMLLLPQEMIKSRHKTLKKKLHLSQLYLTPSCKLLMCLFKLLVSLAW